MGVVQDLVTGVLDEGNFDASSAQARRWLDRRHRKMVARSRCFVQTIPVGPTFAGTDRYLLPPGLVEIMEVVVAGRTYGQGRHTDIAADRQGWLWLSDNGGLVAPDEDDTGGSSIALVPVPTETGQSIDVRAAFMPFYPLSTTDDATLKIPADFHDELIAGAIATALRVVENRPDLASVHEQIFDAGCEELRRQTARRYRGAGPAQIRVVGINA